MKDLAVRPVDGNDEFELDWLQRWNQYAPENVAVLDGDSHRQLTYQQLYRQAVQTAFQLQQRYHIQMHDRVVLLAQNEIESLVLFFALQRLGACLVPINFRLTEREVHHIVLDAQPKLIVAQSAFAPAVKSLDIPQYYFDQDPSLFMLPEDLVAQTHLAEQHPSVGNAHMAATPDSLALILYTSGTTGAPKGAMLSHRMLFWNSVNTSWRLNVTQKDAAVIFLPLFHTGGWNVLTTPFLHRGAKIVLLKKFEAGRVLELTEQQQCTLLFGVPTTMSMMAQHPSFATTDLRQVRYAIVGGEPMSLDHIDIWNRKGVPIRQGYGLTEFGPNVFSLNEEHASSQIGSIGFPNFYVQTKVVDDQGQTCQAHQVGELCLKGPMMMTGYWNNPKATVDTIKDGWLHTGDLVKFNEAGFYYVVGRKKDMFISGGENVYPAEIEQVLSQLPQVLEVAVLGVPDPKWGEVGKAFIVSQPGLSTETLVEHCQKNLAKFKVPKHFEFRSELPKGDSGKILKRLLVTQP